jgi:hypothetical protein
MREEDQDVWAEWGCRGQPGKVSVPVRVGARHRTANANHLAAPDIVSHVGARGWPNHQTNVLPVHCHRSHIAAPASISLVYT